jgi:prepilin-type N-terminal cleavage/methylation domain-containing protein
VPYVHNAASRFRPGFVQPRYVPPGYSILELMIVVTIMGVSSAMAYPRIRTTIDHEDTRSARRHVTAMISQARTTATIRGCRTTAMFDANTGKVWVESCKVSGSGRDTVGKVVRLGTRYGVTMTAGADSIPFASNGVGLATSSFNIGFTKRGYSSRLTVSGIGRTTW